LVYIKYAMNYPLDSFFGASTVLKASELSEYLAEEELFKLKDTGIQYRSVNHWESQNLLSSEAGIQGKRRKFTFIEYMWLQVVSELRTIGLPIPLLKKVKDEIFQTVSAQGVLDLLKSNPELLDKLPDDETKAELAALLQAGSLDESIAGKGASFFELFICETVINKIPLSLVIFSDGYWFPWYEDKIELYSKEDIEKKAYGTHVTVSLSKIIKDFLVDEKSVYILPKLKLFETHEMKLLEIISSGEYEAITINFKNKKIKSLEMVKAQHVKRKIVDILTENAYQDIVIKTHKGMVTTIKNTVKLQFD
jgi:DNA-binding transcriptional MerR regulator